ncbi:SDR family NAD(P)-dependent oxidoreductase [Roseomonas fluvialis]|uniref:NADP-dependent 3-hydroxy acid dehydrogenase YdfG n=1 Tax=Roseomonas fluvialis TaxID=1750527 RepID=A0ABN6PAD7_9PROT|nr:SDR family oxidoreductase [Roseomonas fluvialis]BDG74348.1 oxidoreductase [Roseomonas fluvialis]
MSHVSNAPRTALITGASGGIGSVYADRLARRGYDLVLVARQEAPLRAVADRVAAASGRNVTIVVADLGDASDLHRVEALLRDAPRIGMLVNNAGFGGVTSLAKSDVDRMEAMIAVNVTALTRLTYAAAPAFLARGGGTIVNIASIAALAPELLNGVYGATKAYVLAFTQSLQHELGNQGLRIQAVLPGATATAFWGTAGLGDSSDLPSAIVMTAENLVDAALAGLDSGEVVTIPPLQDGTEWTRYEAQRVAMAPHLGHAQPAPRYSLPRPEAA